MGAIPFDRIEISFLGSIFGKGREENFIPWLSIEICQGNRTPGNAGQLHLSFERARCCVQNKESGVVIGRIVTIVEPGFKDRFQARHAIHIANGNGRERTRFIAGNGYIRIWDIKLPQQISLMIIGFHRRPTGLPLITGAGNDLKIAILIEINDG